MRVSICRAHVSLTGIMKYQRLHICVFARTFAAVVDVKKHLRRIPWRVMNSLSELLSWFFGQAVLGTFTELSKL